MKKKDSTFWNMLWSLTLITAVAGGLLGYTHRLTQEPIARAAKAGREKAIQQVIPKYDNSPIDEQCSYTVRNEYGETTAIVYPAKKRVFSSEPLSNAATPQGTVAKYALSWVSKPMEQFGTIES